MIDKRTWRLAVVRLQGGKVEGLELMRTPIDDVAVALERPLDVGKVPGVRNQDHVLGRSEIALETDLLGGAVAVGEGEAVKICGVRRIPARTFTLLAVTSVCGRHEVDAVVVAE